MDKHEYTMKNNEIRLLLNQKKYEEALDVLEAIDVDKVKVITDLSVYAEVFLQNKMYEDCKDILLRIRERTNGRRVIYQLIRLAVCMKEIDEAEYYYGEYVKTAPKDPERFVLRYRIDKMKDEPVEVLIQSLEKLKEYDYIEIWAYELAKLYHKAGIKEKCISECNDIILWFGEGDIVEKAKILKEMYIGNTEKVEVIKAETKQEVEKQQEFLKTDDLSSKSEQVNQVLLRELESAKQKKEHQEEELKKELEEVLESEIIEEPKETEIIEEIKESEIIEEPKESEIIEESNESEIIEEPKETEIIEEIKESESTEESKETEIIEETKESDSIEESNESDSIEEENIISKEIQLIFQPFMKIEGMVEQISKSITDSVIRGMAYNYILIGEDRVGKVELAKMIAQALWRMNVIKSSRFAKISASSFNRINICSKYETLRDTCLLIEGAGSLSTQGVESLLQLHIQLGNQVVLFLEDTKENIEQLLERHPKLKIVMDETLEPEEANIDYLLYQGITYFHNHEYEVNDDTVRKLKAIIIDILESKEKKEKIQSFYEILDHALKNAEIRTTQQLFEVVTNSKYLNSELNTILVDDFIE